MRFECRTAYMSQVTIRRVDEAWVEMARQEATRLKISMNQVLLDALRRGLGADAQPVKKTNLDAYAGDSDFGPGWDEFLDKDLKKLNRELWS